MAISKKEVWYALKETIAGDKETREKLLEVKKDIVKEYIESIKKDNPNIEDINESLEDYLINDGSFEDIFQDAFKWYWLSFLLPESIDNLNKVKEKISSIQKIPTSEELSSLKSEIMNIKLQTNTSTTQESQISHQQSHQSSWNHNSRQYSHVATWVTAWTVVSSIHEASDWESVEGSAEVWEAKEIELKKRMDRLFPEWVPQTEKQMKRYLTKIKVPILTENWKTKKLKLYVHKKLANEYKAIFEEMKEAWIKVNPDTTACFNRRKMRKSSKMSHHSYGTAIDVNRDVNWWVYWKTDSSSPYFNDQATVEIRKKHGFYRWWDRSTRNNDPMHFTYMNA